MKKFLCSLQFLLFKLATYWLFMWGPNSKILSYSSLEICFASPVNCNYLSLSTVSGRPTVLHSKGIIHHNPWAHHWAASPNFVWCSGVLSRVRQKQMTLLTVDMCPEQLWGYYAYNANFQPYRAPVSISFIICFLALGLQSHQHKDHHHHICTVAKSYLKTRMWTALLDSRDAE